MRSLEIIIGLGSEPLASNKACLLGGGTQAKMSSISASRVLIGASRVLIFSNIARLSAGRSEMSTATSLAASRLLKPERSINQERVQAGLARAHTRGNASAGPPIKPALKERIVAALKAPERTEGVRKIAGKFGVNPSTVQAISRSLNN